ncbi:hypothetical protein C2E20_5954 [Micractinium conductrix]|uniref:Uncharacterized protein n=1 Tax=Micractinium conductrix TaxID=554055 RepID=A0A2P6V963_9CHLO|nr:hypothetical protein C2E20_5954 [Micractinium conductrix]|eukprot:PSC70624.1 hypothetical protein C2E20_5954 [Micractinium conductrix]
MQQQHSRLHAARWRPAKGRTTPAQAAPSAAADRQQEQQQQQRQQLHAPSAELQAAIGHLRYKELQTALQQRRLSVEDERGEPATQRELAARLAAFMAQPDAFPEAHCTAAPTVEVLGGHLFAGMQQLRWHIQMLLQVLQGDLVEEGHPDFEFLSGLLRRHPRYETKVSHPPAVAFRVRTVTQEAQPPIRMFEYMDGREEWEDFSYRQCIGFVNKNLEVLTVRDAMRWAVRDQLEAFRLVSAQAGRGGRPVWACECCGRVLREVRKVRIHHEQPSFMELIKDYSTAAGRPPPPVDGREPESNRGTFTDAEWVAAWRRYHRKHARLQLLCVPCAKERTAGDTVVEAAFS